MSDDKPRLSVRGRLQLTRLRTEVHLDTWTKKDLLREGAKRDMYDLVVWAGHATIEDLEDEIQPLQPSLFDSEEG